MRGECFLKSYHYVVVLVWRKEECVKGEGGGCGVSSGAWRTEGKEGEEEKKEQEVEEEEEEKEERSGRVAPALKDQAITQADGIVRRHIPLPNIK